jgi:mannosyl-oligosaccharide alpha-1,2-mannosidase
MRRYRVFLVFALIATGAIYHLSQTRHWEVADVERFAYIGHKSDPKITEPRLVVDIPPTKAALPATIAPKVDPTSTKPLLDTQTTSTSVVKDTTTSTSLAATKATAPGAGSAATAVLKSRPPTEEEKNAAEEVFVQDFGQHGQGRLEADSHPPGTPMAKWIKQSETFPVPPGKLITLPNTPKALPKIQYKFKTETSGDKADRLAKLSVIKEAFNHAWTGYRDFAIPHDELKSVTGGTADPFMGWGATLVDTLDTLWIMNMTEEFELAVEAVKKIDFHTSPRKDIPLFETTIRYLGGLISAYDLSLGKYPVLLEKALELADVLVGAFDTPNRMPVTYYHWAPSYASQPHRAGTRVVLAEIGSLSVEFTRLAQITKEDKYYDAIARITNALEEYQPKTSLPGLWPSLLDASGCKKPNHPVELASPVQNAMDAAELKYGTTPSNNIVRRQLDDAASGDAGANLQAGKIATSPNQALGMEVSQPSTIHTTEDGSVDCESQGLSNVPNVAKEAFSIGGMADSTYEYFPKEYLLLGGQVEQYRVMYEKAIAAVKENLLFRPMTKNADDILAVGHIDVSGRSTPFPSNKMYYEGTHLSCFAGGMFALGAKVFGVEEDFEIGRKLTEGCIWAYSSTVTGIMPETFQIMPCPSMSHCEWNETAWYNALDPTKDTRIAALQSFNEKQKEFLEDSARIRDELQAAALKKDELDEPASVPDFSKPLSPEEGSQLKRRQLDDLPKYPESKGELSTPTKTWPAKDDDSIQDVADQHPPTIPVNPVAHYEPKAPLTHEEYVAARIHDERLPEGFTRISSYTYGLRPEAIESVFIMYRLTGEQKWRDAGWKMFLAIEGYTRTEIAHAAIMDVTVKVPVLKDSMESFWLAETLKYFYLLFSEPDTISLDDWVFNTEAHPFMRPPV